MNEERFDFKLERQPWMRGDIALRLARVTTIKGRERFAIATNLTLQELDERERLFVPAPLMHLQPSEAQQLMDELWRTGIRPTEGSGSVGQMAATERHLEDMRKLVFNPPSTES